MKWKLSALMLTVALMALFVVSCSGDDEDHDSMMGPQGVGMNGNMDPVDSGYFGMMRAMGNMDSDEMLKEMQEVLGDDDYQKMLAHIADHRDGEDIHSDPDMDRIMHELMDGMLLEMPADEHNIMPMRP